MKPLSIRGFSQKALHRVCEIYVYWSASINPAFPPNKLLLSDAIYFDNVASFLYKGNLHLIDGIVAYIWCIKSEKTDPQKRLKIEDHYLFTKQGAILHFTKANRQLILYEISRRILINSNEDIDDLQERTERICERVFRPINDVGYIAHQLAFPPVISHHYSSKVKAYNLNLLANAIELIATKKYIGFNVFRTLAMYLLTRSLVVTYKIIEKSPEFQCSLIS